jgi:peptide-methionine (R)-S-oxide reductase
MRGHRDFSSSGCRTAWEESMFEDKMNDRNATKTLTRRGFVITGAFAAAGAALWSMHKVQAPRPVDARSLDQTPKEVKIVNFSDSGQKLDTVTVLTIAKSDAEWRQKLSYDAYNVARHAGTERPYSGEYAESHDRGVYRCVCCDTALFNSDTKFESGTGWPSFWQPIAKENVHESADDSLGMARTEVTCRRCEGHLGHVFDDGPQPTGLRYCMNSVAMRFAKSA